MGFDFIPVLGVGDMLPCSNDAAFEGWWVEACRRKGSPVMGPCYCISRLVHAPPLIRVEGEQPVVES